MAIDLQKLHATFQAAEGERNTFDTHWQDVADLVKPTTDFTIRRQTPGIQRHNQIYDNTAPQAADELASALQALLFNPSIRWFSIEVMDKDLARDRAVQQWQYDVTDQGLDYFASTESGWPLASHENALDLVAFGNCVSTVMVDTKDRILKFRARQTPSMYVIEHTDDGRFTHYFRKTDMTGAEISERWPDSPGAQIITNESSTDPTGLMRKREVIHAVVERNNRNPLSPANTDMPWASVYYLRERVAMLGEGGFLEAPFIFARWSKSPEESYGRSPAMRMLPAIKTANVMKRVHLIASELAVRPPMHVPANGYEGPIRTAPGSMNYFRSGLPELAQPMLTGVRPDQALKDLMPDQQAIKEAFFTDRFKLPDNDRMTATEIVERRRDALFMASPILSRLYAEWMRPSVMHWFRWAQATRRLPPMPSSMNDRSVRLRVDFTSPLASSQRGTESQNFISMFAQITPLIQADPEVMDNIDSDEQVRLSYQMNGINPKGLRDKREVDAIRRERREQEQAAQTAAVAKDAGAAVKDLAQGVSTVQGTV